MYKYLIILVDSLKKKNHLLDEINKILSEQEQVCATEPFSIERINELMDSKKDMLSELELLDDGFASLYERVSPVLKDATEDYRNQIIELQGLIKQISDKTALIQAREMRIHQTVARLLTCFRPEAPRQVPKQDAALKYLKTMNKSNTPASSIFMDSRK